MSGEASSSTAPVIAPAGMEEQQYEAIKAYRRVGHFVRFPTNSLKL